MKNSNTHPNILNKSLRVFFTDALKVAVKNPAQAVSFFRTLLWLRKASRIRSNWQQQGFNIPPIIIFSITNQCNLKCKGCYAQSFHHPSGEELSDRRLKSIVDEAAGLGVSFFVVAGGEPLMRNIMLDIMKAHPQIIFLVFTNGLLINDEMIATFKKHKNIVPLVSLEGDKNDTDKRRGEGTYDHLQHVMKNMKKDGIFFGNSLTLTRPNFQTITGKQYIEELVTSGCKFFLFIEYTPIVEKTKDWVLTEEQRSQMRDLMNVYRSKYPALFIAVPWDEDDVGGCLSAGRGFVHINAAGDLEPCPFAPFSDVNVRKTPLINAFQSKFLQRIRQVPELAKETGEGCVLWKERDRVKSLLNIQEPVDTNYTETMV